METPPFRLDTRTLPGDYDAAEAERELALIEGEARPDPISLGRWLVHPDERVALAAMKRFAPLMRSPDVTDALMARIRETERVEPGVWTPVHDASAPVRVVPFDPFTKPFERWFRSASAEEALPPLRAFLSDEPRWVASKAFRDWTPQVVRAVAAGQERNIERMARNPALLDQPECVATLFDAAAQVLERTRYSYGMKHAAKAVGLLYRRSRLPPEATQRLEQLLDAEQDRIAREVALALGHRPQGVSDARRTLARIGERRKVVAGYLKGPEVPLPIVRQALRESPSLAARRAVIRRKDALADPEIRAILAESDCARVLTALIESGQPDEAEALLARLCTTNPHRALEAIEDHLPEGASVPTRGAAALLGSDNRRVRERALRVTGSRSLGRDS